MENTMKKWIPNGEEDETHEKQHPHEQEHENTHEKKPICGKTGVVRNMETKTTFSWKSFIFSFFYSLVLSVGNFVANS